MHPLRTASVALAGALALVPLWVQAIDVADPPAQPAPADAAELRRAMLAAEDGRPLTREQAAPLLAGLKSTLPSLQRSAVRALGRLEDPQFADAVISVMDAASFGVRAEAANALGQIVGKQPEIASGVLFKRLAVERDGTVRGVLCETLGRIPYASPGDIQRAEQALADEARGPGTPESREGAVKGLESLMRRGWSKPFRAAPSTIDVLQKLAVQAPGGESGAPSARVRRLAMLALAAGRILGEVQVAALGDPDPQVRRLAIVALMPDVAFEKRAAMIERALNDPSAMVRCEAVRVHARHLARTSCDAEIAALNDADEHVRLMAIDQLGLASSCPGDLGATSALAARAGRVRDLTADASPSRDWQTPAHAIVALARRAPEEAKRWLPGFAASRNWQLRMYAARAADALGDTAALESLSRDSNGNVQEVALAGLVRVQGRGADRLLLEMLERPGQAVIQAARGLKGTPLREEASRALLRALASITLLRQETSRDPRLAMLERIGELGDLRLATELEPYLEDFDPAIAERAAEVLEKWTGKPWKPNPNRTAGVPAPTPADIDALPPGFRVTLEGGRSFDVKFYLDDTPITAWRIMRKVKEGYYNGLTFHRILPGFIIQGGSPGANEFAGDGPFMRDEFSLRTNARGTLGVSTRGRDTGDAQFYVNLVDNPRLDHEYTVFGEITSGIDAIDGISEGDRIVRIDPLPVPAPPKANGGGL